MGLMFLPRKTESLTPARMPPGQPSERRDPPPSALILALASSEFFFFPKSERYFSALSSRGACLPVAADSEAGVPASPRGPRAGSFLHPEIRAEILI